MGRVPQVCMVQGDGQMLESRGRKAQGVGYKAWPRDGFIRAERLNGAVVWVMVQVDMQIDPSRLQRELSTVREQSRT